MQKRDLKAHYNTCVPQVKRGEQAAKVDFDQQTAACKAPVLGSKNTTFTSAKLPQKYIRNKLLYFSGSNSKDYVIKNSRQF